MDQDDKVEKHHKPSFGIPLVILACFFNACMATFAKIISKDYGLPNQILVFSRFSVSFLFILPLLLLLPKYRPIKKSLTIKVWQPYAIRIGFGLLTIYAYFYAIQHISLGNAVLLTYTSPLFIPVVLWVWRGVAISKRTWIGLIVGFMGVALIIGPKIEKLEVGYLIGTIAGITAAVSYIAARLQSYSEEPICVNFYFFLVTALISFIFCGRSFIELIPTFSPRLWVLLFLMGLSGALFQGLIIIALRWAQVRFLGAFLYFTVAFAMLLEWMLFGKLPSTFSIGGLFLVLLGALLMTLLDPERQKIVNKSESS